MFNWVISGIPHNYEPRRPISRAVSGVDRISPTEQTNTEAAVRSATEEKHNPLRGYAQPERNEPRQKAIVARQIMSTPVFSLPAQTSLSVAWAAFKDHRFRHIPVVSPEKKLLGIISDRDLLKEAAHLGDNGSSHPARNIGEIMVKEVLVANPDTPIREIAKVMFEERVGSMPVLEGDSLVGIVTRADILRTVMTQVPMELWI